MRSCIGLLDCCETDSVSTVTGNLPTFAPHNGLLWTGVLLSPIAWAAQLQAVYVLADQACKGNVARVALDGATIGCLALALLGGLLSAVQWRRGRRLARESEILWRRAHWMALEGMLSGVLFGVVIVAQWLAVMYLNPCPMP